MLHTEALLSAINFLSAALSSGGTASLEREIRPKTEDKAASAKSCERNSNHHELTLLISCLNVSFVFPVSRPGVTRRK